MQASRLVALHDEKQAQETAQVHEQAKAVDMTLVNSGAEAHAEDVGDGLEVEAAYAQSASIGVVAAV